MYPEGIDPQSGCRIPFPKREDLDEDGKAIYDMLADPKGGTIRGLKGPGGIQLNSPSLAKLNRPVGRYLRQQTGMGGRTREIAILTTARECDSQFEWAAHESEALQEGVPAAIIDIIKHRRSTEALDERDKVVIDLGREAFGARAVSQATFERALKQFGVRMLVDLVALMGNYSATAVLLATFGMQLDPGVEPPLPMG